MKVTLLICLSLLVSLLHAAAMPITGLGNSAIVPTAGEIKQNSHDHHASMQHDSNHEEPETYCPEAESHCCLIVVLQSSTVTLSTLFFREEFYASRALNRPIFRPEALYKPPRFYPAPAG